MINRNRLRGLGVIGVASLAASVHLAVQQLEGTTKMSDNMDQPVEPTVTDEEAAVTQMTAPETDFSDFDDEDMEATSGEEADVFGAVEGGVVENHNLRSMIFAGQTADVGLDGLFNTFRMGSRWANLKYGDPIMCMVDSTDGNHYVELPRLANVLAVHTGTLADMLLLHLGLNHAGLQGLNPLEQLSTLKAILEKCYGEKFDGHEDCTVIYLIRDAA